MKLILVVIGVETKKPEEQWIYFKNHRDRYWMRPIIILFSLTRIMFFEMFLHLSVKKYGELHEES